MTWNVTADNRPQGKPYRDVLIEKYQAAIAKAEETMAYFKSQKSPGSFDKLRKKQVANNARLDGQIDGLQGRITMLQELLSDLQLFYVAGQTPNPAEQSA